MSLGHSFFCSEVTLEVNSTRSGASVYLITQVLHPSQTGLYSFTIRSTLLLSSRSGRTYQYWNYYLYPGSNFTNSVRVLSFYYSSSTFRLFKLGSSNFQQWVNNQSSTNGLLDSFSIPCTIGYTHQYSYQVQDEDEYYFVYHRKPDCRPPDVSVTTRPVVIDLQVNMSGASG